MKQYPLALAAPALTAALALVAPAPAAAQPPPGWELQIQARSNFTGAFNLPDGAFLANTTARLTDDRRLAFDLAVLPGGTTQGLWHGGDGMGGIVYESPSGAFVLDLGIDDGGVVFELADSAQDGLWIYDPAAPPAAFATNQPLGASSWGSPGINAAGELGYRAGFGPGRAYASFDGTPPAAIHATEAGIDGTSPYSFLFTPSFNALREIAGKVRLGGPGQTGESQPDQVRVFAADGTSRLIAEDRDSNPASPYSRFDNSVSLTDLGTVAFIAELADTGDRVVVLSDGTIEIEIASEADPEISEIEFFAPAANESGQVAFRAFDGTGLRAVWLGDGQTLLRIAREHDLVPSDLGPARIDQHDGSPVFGGGVGVNRRGDVTFMPGLTPPDDNQIEWGSGVYVGLSPRLFADGFESGDLTAWSTSFP